MKEFGKKTALNLWAGVKVHARSLDVLLPLLGVILIVDILTFTAGFASNDDPGTYWAQAWAIIHRGDLAHYTYWYDHPPFGWMQMALYAWLTDGYGRSGAAVLTASELMVIAQLISCTLIFMLMRRLQFNRVFAALAVVLFALSPLAIQYQKMAFLDNLSVMWLLASMVFAASPRRSLGSAFGAGLCMTFAALTKETAVIWVVVVAYLLWQNGTRGYRKWSFGTYLGTFFVTSVFYPLYAVLKGELFPGSGHVSLVGSLMWQLGRAKASDTLSMWLGFDHWLLYFTLATLPFALCVRRLRPVAVGFCIMAYMVVRGGYIPSPLVIGILPFAALTVAGTLGALWPLRSEVRLSAQRMLRWRAFSWLHRTSNRRASRYIRIGLALAALGSVFVVVTPSWSASIQHQSPRDEVYYYEQTVAWVEQNVPDKNAVIAVDDNMWTDLTEAGYTNVVWFYKLELDPAVVTKYVGPGVGYKGIDYVVLKKFYYSIAGDVNDSVILQARNHGHQVAQIGNNDPAVGHMVEPYLIYKVVK